MKSIPLPLKFEYKSISKNKGQFIIEPFYPGYGTTIGNSLRRVLLSSLPGAAITAIKIKGADHEFSTIPNVKEDVIDIILNFKKVRIKVTQDLEEPIRLYLKAKGEEIVKAGDFEKQAGVEIVNPELTIATITENAGELEMEVMIAKGRGYWPVELRHKEDKEIGVIDIDALFSPIRQVGFETEHVRVGEITNYERVILTIETDGTITCQDALQETMEILINHYQHLSDQLTGGKARKDEEGEKEKERQKETKEENKAISKEIEEEKKMETTPQEIKVQVAEIGEKPKRKRGRPRKSEENKK